MEYAIAVLDIGKTNKKLAVYSPDLKVLSSESRPFPTQLVDGIEIEPVDAVEAWFLDRLAAVSSSFPIRSITVATHGAALVCIDEAGSRPVPVLSYTHEPGDQFHRDFYALAGDKAELQRRTATLELPALINPAQNLYFLQRSFPEGFEKVAHVLFYPQYFGYRLTGQIGADLTYTGCHSYLYDFGTQDWSWVAERLGVADKLPAARSKPWEVLGTLRPEIARKTGLDAATTVTMGIHDSNSSLLPYLVKKEGELILNSTGTWCVAMHPMDRVYFRDDEIGKSVFYNIAATGWPVKTTILMGGQEFEAYTSILKGIHGETAFPQFSAEVYRKVIAEKRRFILPSVVSGTGQFPDSRAQVIDGDEIYPLAEIQAGTRVPGFFEDYAEAYAVLNLSLAVQSMVALQRLDIAPGIPVYTEGGFRNNYDYNVLLASLFPESPWHTTDIAEATAFGAAIVGKVAHEGIEPADTGSLFEIGEKTFPPMDLGDLEGYAASLIRRVS